MLKFFKIQRGPRGLRQHRPRDQGKKRRKKERKKRRKQEEREEKRRKEKKIREMELGFKYTHDDTTSFSDNDDHYWTENESYAEGAR